MTYDERRQADLIDRKSDTQRQLDALCGEDPGECERLRAELDWLTREIL